MMYTITVYSKYDSTTKQYSLPVRVIRCPDDAVPAILAMLMDKGHCYFEVR